MMQSNGMPKQSILFRCSWCQVGSQISDSDREPATTCSNCGYRRWKQVTHARTKRKRRLGVVVSAVQPLSLVKGIVETVTGARDFAR